MYAYIKNNNVEYRDRYYHHYMEKDYDIIIEYSDSIINPLYVEVDGNKTIVEANAYFVEQDIKRINILDKLIKIENITNVTEEMMEGVALTEDEMNILKSKRMYKDGLEDKVTKLFFMMAQGNFSAGQELGYEMRQEYARIESMRYILTGVPVAD